MNRSLLGFPRGRRVPGLSLRRRYGFPLAENRALFFPQGKDFATTDNTASATNHTVNLPSGIAAGDIILLAVAGNSSGGAATSTGFVQLQFNTENQLNATLLARLCDGSEGATITVTHPSSSMMAACALLVRGAYQYSMVGSDVPKSAQVQSTRDAPALTPGRGTCKFLWVFMGLDAANSAMSDPGDNDHFSGSVGSSTTRVAMATKRYEVDSYNPGSFGSGTSRFMAFTVALPPAGLAV